MLKVSNPPLLPFLLPFPSSPPLTNISTKKAYKESGDKDPSGWTLPSWSLDATKSVMNDQDISTTILSLTAPGCTLLSGPVAAQLAREVNESAAAIRDAEPSRFGFFAALPPILDDMDAAVREAIHALDELHADGVTLYTRYGPGNTYLGDVAFLPLWTALNARHAVVFIHPTHLPSSDLVNPHLPQPLIDYPHETTRAAVDLLMNRRVRDFPNCRIILSHAGGTLPYLVKRAAHTLVDYGLSSQPAEDFLADARTLYYDLALSGNEFTLALLLRFVGPEKILFGTDFPYAPLKTIETNTKELDEFDEVRGETKHRIERGNAQGLFPRLKAYDWVTRQLKIQKS